MDDNRREVLFDQAITKAASASSLEALLGVVLSLAAGTGFVAVLVWSLGKPLIDAPIAYAIVFAAASLIFTLTIGLAYVGQQVGDLARATRAVALSRPS